MSMDKIRLTQAVIVEGKYDKIKLDSVLDALILPTDGFRIYKNKEQQALLRRLATTRGLIILTDSDAAGFKIRGFLSGLVPKGTLTHVYIPDLYGKEKRKREASAEGKLGVEGMNTAVLREAFSKAGVLTESSPPPTDPVTREDLYDDGFIGGLDSSEKRRKLYKALDLPERMSTSSALQILSHMLSREQYNELIKTIL